MEPVRAPMTGVEVDDPRTIDDDEYGTDMPPDDKSIELVPEDTGILSDDEVPADENSVLESS